MSTIGGIYNLNAQAVDSHQLMRIGKAIEQRGPDGGDHCLRGSVGMVYRAFHTNSESTSEKQPFVSREGHMLCWDGRLDNRGELISELKNYDLEDHTDVAIVLGAFRKWNEGFLSRLVGDFALSLWDNRSQTLLLARDPVGVRPLYYHATGEMIVWSSELTPLIELPSLRLEVDEDYVAGFLANSLDPGATPYRYVRAVPPGHVAKVTKGALELRRFWKLNPDQKIRYKTDAEYEEHFRYLFREAVRCRLRVNGPAWATLSGGLDSSSIVCMADDILASGDAEASKLETVSYVYDESTSCDELNFVEVIENFRGRAGKHLSEGDYPLLGVFPEESDITYPDFVDCFFARHQGLCNAMSADGARVIITGHGGDEVLCSGANPSFELADLLLQGKWISLNQSLRAWSRFLRKSYFSMLLRDLAIPLMPRNVQIFCGLVPKNLQLPSWFDPEFVARTNLKNRNLNFANIFNFKLPSERAQAGGFLSAVGFVSRASFRTRGRIELSHPYLDRRLVEFLQAIPHEQRIRPGETRSLMRRALRGLVPEKVLNRKTKRGPDEALLRAMVREWPRLQTMFNSPRVQDHGYMNADLLLAALERARHGCKTSSFAPTICLELWLQAFEHRRSKAKSTDVSTVRANEDTEVRSHEALGTLTPVPQV
ncbi:MAG TPA: asparagine synthase-related protein [Pyrinomonadaceae bacterium]|nr:asparagine synthase-related protein [Pyrinomonadaceae bacterium]